MQLLRGTLMGCLIVGLAGCGGASSNKPASQGGGKPPEQKTQASNKDKIVGTWVPTKPTPGDPESIEFSKDGKTKLTAKDGNGKPITMEAAYTVDGDKVTITMKIDGKEKKETATITKLSDTEMVTKDEKGKIEEFKKK
jgi:uncharacterized protein (TIGR03066 family)